MIFNRRDHVCHCNRCRSYIGTARFALLGLRRVQLVVQGPKAGPSPIIEALPADTALLFPDPSGVAREPPVRPRHLLVLDGTWAHAQKLFLAHPSLASMPRIGLAGSQPSRYRIRREPDAHCLSTIEGALERS